MVTAFEWLNSSCAVGALQDLPACPPVDNQGDFVLPGEPIAVIVHIMEADGAEIMQEFDTGGVLLAQLLVVHGKRNMVYMQLGEGIFNVVPAVFG